MSKHNGTTALERLQKNDKIGPYAVTDKIVLQPLTGKQAREFEETSENDARFKIWFGDQYEPMMEFIESIPVHYVVPLFRDMCEHFFETLIPRDRLDKMLKQFDEISLWDEVDDDDEEVAPVEG